MGDQPRTRPRAAVLPGLCIHAVRAPRAHGTEAGMSYAMLGFGIAVFLLGLAMAGLVGGAVGFAALLAGIGIMGAGVATALTGTRAPQTRGRGW